MNKQEQINKLTREYFWEQKIDEVVKPFVVFVALILFTWFVGLGVPIALGNSIGDGYSTFCIDEWDVVVPEKCSVFEMWIEGILYIIIALMIFISLWLLFETVNDWLNKNWKRAKLRAANELKSNSIKRRKK